MYFCLFHGFKAAYFYQKTLKKSKCNTENFKSPKDETNLYNAVCVGNSKFKTQMGDGYEKGIKQCREQMKNEKFEFWFYYYII